MSINLRGWIGQATTGHGVMILLPTILAMVTGELSMAAGVPLLVAAVVGLLWPENTALKGAVQTVAADVETVVSAYRAGMHQAALTPPADPQARPPSPAVAGSAVAGPAVTGLAVLALAALALSACAGQTGAQRVAAIQAATQGVLCLAQTTDAVAPLVTAADPDAVKAAHAAAAAENALVSDRACQAALQGAASP